MKTEFCVFTMPLHNERLEVITLPLGAFFELPGFDSRYNVWRVEDYDTKEHAVLCRCVSSRIYEKNRLVILDGSKKVRSYGAPVFKGVDK